jgi:integrase/recombinase XerC
MKDQVDGFRDYLINHGRSRQTALAYSGDVRRFTDWMIEDGSTDFGDAANRYVTELRQEQAAATVTRAMSAIRAFREYLMRRQVITTEPFVGYRAPKRQRATAHPLPGMMDDVDAMVKGAWRPHHKILIGLCGYAGLRVSEARSITPRSLYQDNDERWWLAIYGKGGVYREVPVSDKLLELLVEYADADTPDTPYVPVQDRAARKAITEIGARVGIAREVSSHDLRHTFGTDVYSRTKDLRITQELLGHASSSTTEGYTGVTAAAKLAAIDASGQRTIRLQPEVTS